MKNENISIEQFINEIFCHIPKSPCYYTIDDVNIVLLTHLMLAGANKLFGKVTPGTITKKQFEILNECMESIGYTIKYNMDKEKCKIWFEPYTEKTNCKGFRTL
jgi:ubiquitin C-terminal hydrolase